MIGVSASKFGTAKSGHTTRQWVTQFYALFTRPFTRWEHRRTVMFVPPKAAPRCRVQGCKRPHEAKNLCKAHYARFLRHGSPTAGYRSKGAAQAWLAAHVSHKGKRCLI
jgi:hypothetical protein